MNQIFKFITEDNILFEVDREVALESNIIQNMEDILGTDSDDPIVLKNINSQTFQKVIEWISHHHTEQKDKQPETPGKVIPVFIDIRINKKNQFEVFSDWDLNFFKKMSFEELKSLIEATNFLNIKPLFELSCKYCAKSIQATHGDEIKRLLEEAMNDEKDESLEDKSHQQSDEQNSSKAKDYELF